MSEELEMKNTIQCKLPRSFYDFYMENHLWKEFSSFSDWVRDSVRKSRDKWRVRKSIEGISSKHGTKLD